MEEKLDYINHGRHITLLSTAIYYSNFATCKRLKVGAVITDPDMHIVGVGFNTSIIGTPTCEEEGCRMHNDSCVRTIHAEVYAVRAATKFRGNVEGCTVYCTDQPCADCLKYLSMQGVRKVYFVRPYRHKYDVDTDIELIHIPLKMQEI